MMNGKRLTWIWMSVVVAIVAMVGCNNEPVTPNVGADRVFTVNAGGTALRFEPSRINATYDSVTHNVLITGVMPADASTAMPARDLRLQFNSDLMSGSYPRTLTAGEGTILYTLTSFNDTTSYICGAGAGGSCSITITSFESPRRIDGTFAATLKELTDSTRIVPVGARADTSSTMNLTNGSFSLVLY
jgi:hypothetical protein